MNPSATAGTITAMAHLSLRAVFLAASIVAPAALAAALEPVNLRSTAGYAVLAGSLVSNIPGSALTGDVGLSPAAGSMITGFGALEVTGTVYTVDATGPAGSVAAASDLTVAQGDLTLAYNDAAGREPVPAGEFLNPGAGNIGGLTLVPGLYKFTGGLEISGSDLTLEGGEDDVWIFQIASDLNVGNGIKVILADDARAGNVFWQVGTSATLGTTSVFKGTIMADQSISMNTGSSLEGRALASIAAVTLASSTITVPEPATASVGRFSRGGGSAMSQDFANPFLPMAEIGFRIPRAGWASLRIVDVHGREVANLFEGLAEPGTDHRVRFATAGLAGGLYFSKLQSGGRTHSRPLIVAH